MFEIIDHICLGQRITLWHTNNRYIPTYTNIMAYNQFITSIEREKKEINQQQTEFKIPV